MRTRYRNILLVVAFLLTLSAWAYASELVAEPPESPDTEAGLLDADSTQAASGTNLTSGDKSLGKLAHQEIVATDKDGVALCASVSVTI